MANTYFEQLRQQGLAQAPSRSFQQDVDETFGRYVSGQRLTPGQGKYEGETFEQRQQEFGFQTQDAPLFDIGSLGRGIAQAGQAAWEGAGKAASGLGEFAGSGLGLAGNLMGGGPEAERQELLKSFSSGGFKALEGGADIVGGTFGGMVEAIPSPHLREGLRFAGGEVGRAVGPAMSGGIDVAAEAFGADPDDPRYQQIKKGAFDTLAIVTAPAAFTGMGKLATSAARMGAKGATKAGQAAAGAIRPVTSSLPTFKAPTIKGSALKKASEAAKARVTSIDSAADALRKSTSARNVRQASIKTGLERADIKLMSGASKADARKMFNIAKQNVGKRGPTIKPTDVPGKKIADSIGFLQKIDKTAGAKLGDIVKKIGNKNLNVKPVLSDFMDQTKRLGVSIGKNGKLEFGNSIIKNSSTARRAVAAVYDDLAKYMKNPMAKVKDLDKMRKSLFELQDDLMKAQGGATKEALNFISRSRSNMNKAISNLDSSYGKYAKQVAKSKTGIEEINKYLGIKDPTDAVSIGMRSGEVARRVMGNASARPITELSKLERILRSLLVLNALIRVSRTTFSRT